MSEESKYFLQRDQEAKARMKAKLDAQAAEAEAAARRELHHHMCGKCGNAMDTNTFRGVEIEVCQTCGAVLLDPGELEELAGHDDTDLLTSFFTMFGAKAR